MTNLAELLMGHPFTDDEGLLHTITETVTAGEARAAARSVATSLADAGVGAGQAVAVQLPNGPAAVHAMVGAWLAGAVFVPVNPRHPAAEVHKVVLATEPAALMTENGITRRPNGRTYAAGVGFVLWTSGTTGAPKPILHTHDGYLEIIDRVLGALRGGGRRDAAARPSPNLIPVSLSLNAGIYNTLFGLRAGAALVIMDRFEAAEFASLVQRFDIRSTVLPPAALTTLADDPTVRSLQPLKYVRSITAPLAPRQARRFTEKFGAFVLNSYGQAEIGEVIGWTAADAKAHPDKIGAVGRPHAGVTLKIVADDGGEAAVGGVGVLKVRPPNRAVGYAAGDELGDRIDGDGFVDTGDLARIDGEGFVWIEGRVGDLINRGGNKVFPDEVEDVLRTAPGVRDVAVAGMPDERLGQVPVAFVVGTAAVTDLEQLGSAHLVPYKVPTAFHFVEEIPRTEVGKVRRQALISAADLRRS